jgi:hypothetical protein
LGHFPQAGCGWQQCAGRKVADLFQIDELFEIMQRLMRGDIDRPAGGGRHPWSGKLECRAEIGERRFALIKRCPHAGQHKTRCMFPGIGLRRLDGTVFRLGEVPQLKGYIRQGGEYGRRGVPPRKVAQGASRLGVAAIGDDALYVLRHRGL